MSLKLIEPSWLMSAGRNSVMVTELLLPSPRYVAVMFTFPGWASMYETTETPLTKDTGLVTLNVPVELFENQLTKLVGFPATFAVRTIDMLALPGFGEEVIVTAVAPAAETVYPFNPAKDVQTIRISKHDIDIICLFILVSPI